MKQSGRHTGIETPWTNYKILFYDSGLDSSSSLQCVMLLRDIARSGRTVKLKTQFKTIGKYPLINII